MRPTSYVLAAGDRLSLLAKRHGIDYELLIRSNPGVRPRDMEVGEVIVLPLPSCVDLSETETVKEIRRGIRGLGRMALTFDAGADVGALDALLTVLRDRQVRSTFFVTGRFLERHPDAFRRILDGGHEAFNHSFSHPSFTEVSDEQILDELEETERMFRRTVGRGARPFFRPPYGDRDQRVLDIAAGAGWQCVYWTFDSLDSIRMPKTSDQIINRITRPPRAKDPVRFLDGSIILFHAAKEWTAQAIGPIIDHLRYQGLEPVTLTALLDPPPLEPREKHCVEKEE